MSEIWNLSTLCRCCHADGYYRSLNWSDEGENGETYAFILHNTFGMSISTPPLEASYTICDECINKLRHAHSFKKQVLECEDKFRVYCNNEQFLNTQRTVKTEFDGDDLIDDNDPVPETDDKVSLNVKKECHVEIEINSAKEIKNEHNVSPMLEENHLSSRVIQENKLISQNPPPIKRGRPKKKKRGRPKISEKSRAEQLREARQRYYRKTLLAKKSLIKHNDLPKPEENNLLKLEENSEKTKEIEENSVKNSPNSKEILQNSQNSTKKIPPKLIRRETPQISFKSRPKICDASLTKRKPKQDKKNIIKIQRLKIDKSLIIEVNTENGIQYSCKDCGGCYHTQKEIYNHINRQHSTLIKCEYCPKQLKSSIQYKNHLKQHSIKEFKCNYCPKKFATKFSMKDHENLHTREKTYICDICQKQFKYKQTLKRHLILHGGTNKKELCDVCGWSFNDKTNLNIHIKTVHLKLRPFACTKCNKTYTLKKHLKMHMRLHDGSEKEYSCEICGYRLMSAKYMTIHRLKHDKKYMCRICPMVFDDPGERKEHVKNSHVNILSCPICGKMFCHKTSLTRHVDSHNGILKFSCEFCGLKFSQKSILTRHIFRKHRNPDFDTDKGKTKCEICKRAYINMEKHMDSHNNRNYACDICEKSYACKKTLARHKSMTHFREDRKYNCDMCCKTYKIQAKLETHKRKLHKIEIEIDCGDNETN